MTLDDALRLIDLAPTGDKGGVATTAHGSDEEVETSVNLRPAMRDRHFHVIFSLAQYDAVDATEGGVPLEHLGALLRAVLPVDLDWELTREPRVSRQEHLAELPGRTVPMLVYLERYL